MSNNECTKCPNCGKIAQGKSEIDRLFGYRNMGDGRIIPQSWCKKCRERGRNNND